MKLNTDEEITVYIPMSDMRPQTVHVFESLAFTVATPDTDKYFYIEKNTLIDKYKH